MFVSVGLIVKVIDKAESVKEFVMSAERDFDAELADSVTSGVSERDNESVNVIDGVSESVAGIVLDSVSF